MIAALMGRSRKRPLRKDWESVKDSIMHGAVLAKFTQHANLRETSLGTGNATIVEHTEKDRYWGDGATATARTGWARSSCGSEGSFDMATHRGTIRLKRAH